MIAIVASCSNNNNTTPKNLEERMRQYANIVAYFSRYANTHHVDIMLIHPEYYFGYTGGPTRYRTQTEWLTFQKNLKILSEKHPRLLLVPGTTTHSKKITGNLSDTIAEVRKHLTIMEQAWSPNKIEQYQNDQGKNNIKQDLSTLTRLLNKAESAYNSATDNDKDIYHRERRTRGKYLNRYLAQHRSGLADEVVNQYNLATDHNDLPWDGVSQYRKKVIDTYLNEFQVSVGKNTLLAACNGKILQRYDKLCNFNESNPTDAIFHPGNKYSPAISHQNPQHTMTHKGQNFSFEICMDHGCRVRKKILQTYPNEKMTEIHIIVSDYVTTDQKTKVAQALLHASTNSSESGLYIWTGNYFSGSYSKKQPQDIIQGNSIPDTDPTAFYMMYNNIEMIKLGDGFSYWPGPLPHQPNNIPWAQQPNNNGNP